MFSSVVGLSGSLTDAPNANAPSKRASPAKSFISTATVVMSNITLAASAATTAAKDGADGAPSPFQAHAGLEARNELGAARRHLHHHHHHSNHHRCSHRNKPPSGNPTLQMLPEHLQRLWLFRQGSLSIAKHGLTSASENSTPTKTHHPSCSHYGSLSRQSSLTNSSGGLSVTASPLAKSAQVCHMVADINTPRPITHAQPECGT